MDKDQAPLCSYYQSRDFNPVPIELADEAAWSVHLAKRTNLYQHHLNIPLGLIRDHSVIEFGCNSGENALVLAHFGAKLTLVEPNKDVLPRLHELFTARNLQSAIDEVVVGDLNSYSSDKLHDLVLAEGFLFSLPQPHDSLRHLIELIRPGGIGVTSFQDSAGTILEFTRRALLWHAYRLEGLEEIHSEKGLEIALGFFEEDFNKISASRPFEAWWKDTMLNPVFSASYLTSWFDVVETIQNAGCEFHGSSPQWSTGDHCDWYKNTYSVEERHQRILHRWTKLLPYFISGEAVALDEAPAKATVQTIEQFGISLAKSVAEYESVQPPVPFCKELGALLSNSNSQKLQTLANELKALFDWDGYRSPEDVIKQYQACTTLRTLWGVPYQYFSFYKLA